MSVEHFNNGSVLVTGKDIYEYLLQGKRNSYKKNCGLCKHQDSELCEECSRKSGDRCCSCHILSPCGFCERDAFEVVNELINYKNYTSNSRKGYHWETFPSTKEIFDKYILIEKSGYVLSAEILLSGEVSVYLDKDSGDPSEKDEIEVCQKVNFKNVAEDMIRRFLVEKQEATNAK